jgi:hypothetical protein
MGRCVRLRRRFEREGRIGGPKSAIVAQGGGGLCLSLNSDSGTGRFPGLAHRVFPIGDKPIDALA